MSDRTVSEETFTEYHQFGRMCDSWERRDDIVPTGRKKWVNGHLREVEVEMDREGWVVVEDRWNFLGLFPVVSRDVEKKKRRVKEWVRVDRLRETTVKITEAVREADEKAQ